MNTKRVLRPIDKRSLNTYRLGECKYMTFRIVVPEVTATCFPSTDDECRMIIFKEPIADREMRDHVIRMEKVPNQGSCRVLCFTEPNCVSINFGPKRKGIHKCELNNATEESQTVAGLHKKMDYIYLGIEVKCLNVKFQCTQFSCRIALSVHDSLTALLFLLDIILCVFLLALSANPNSVFGHSQDSVRHISKHRQKIDKNTPPRTIFSTIFSVFGKWSGNGSFCV